MRSVKVLSMSTDSGDSAGTSPRFFIRKIVLLLLEQCFPVLVQILSSPCALQLVRRVYMSGWEYFFVSLKWNVKYGIASDFYQIYWYTVNVPTRSGDLKSGSIN